MDCRDDDARAEHSRKIRELNDQLRREMPHGSILLTRAVARLDDTAIRAILRSVHEFNDFTVANDPWGEHDFGQVKFGNEQYFWKIDAFDLDLQWGSPDPTDATVTRRILTIMTAEDL